MLATRRALVDGHGLVGGALRSQMHFDVHVGRRDVVRLLDESFDLVVCATTAPGNACGASLDADHLSTVARTVARVRARHVVVLSSTNVFDARTAADERSPIGTGDVSTGDRLAAWFEDAVREYHPSLLALRLPPCLIGVPLEPSLIADLIVSANELVLDPPEAYQLYDTSKLSSDLQVSLDEGIDCVNLVTEPVDLRAIVDMVGSRGAASYVAAHGRAVREPVQTRHAALLGGADRYVADRSSTLTSIGRWWRMQMGGPVRQVS